LDPALFVGGIPVNFGGGVRRGDGCWAVVEGDEYDSAFFDKGPKFLHYRPEKVILTSLEFDHADIYRDLDHIKSAFRGLAEIIPASGALLVCNEYEAAKEVSHAARCPVTFYGNGEPRGWLAKNVHVREGRALFEPCYATKSEGFIEISLIGRHNVDNALGVYAMARVLGIEPDVIKNAFKSFAGVRRRQEVRGEVGGVMVIDDFAHHPTAVRETIGAVREAYPGRRLWAIFEPRSHTSRRRIFERELSQSLALADRVVVAGLYQPEKIPHTDRLAPAMVVEEIGRLCGDTRAAFIEKADDIAIYVAENSEPGDIALVMSNGIFDRVQEKILTVLGAKVP
jgi:UDP-N-acetylmuramate: L-alanyl-gamma-D-glutamyl-meso-diaminopimelate ligase